MKSSLGTLLESGESGRYLLEGKVDPSVARLQALARGYQFIELDCRGVSEKSGLMETAARAFALPGHFGNNWDALADCLMDLSWTPGLRWVVLVHGLDRLHVLDPDSSRTLLEILAETCEFWEEQERPFIALLTEDCGPEALHLPPVAFT